MRRVFGCRKVPWLQLALAGLIVWLAQVSLIETDATAQRPNNTGTAAIERPPLRFIKDPNPAFQRRCCRLRQQHARGRGRKSFRFWSTTAG